MVQVRNRETGAMDSGAHFMIPAIAKPDMRGRVTVLGRVVEGLDTVKTICQVPTIQTPTRLRARRHGRSSRCSSRR